MTITETVYGPGGYDPAKPAGNVVDTKQVAIPITEQNRQSLTDKATQAIAVNATFLGVASPTNAQVVAQTKALTRQTSALIRLLLNQLDDTSGT